MQLAVWKVQGGKTPSDLEKSRYIFLSAPSNFTCFPPELDTAINFNTTTLQVRKKK